MKKFLRITGISLLVLLIVYLVLCAVAPPMAVEKSVVINAKDSVIFSKIGDFKQWHSWSPWEEADAEITKNMTISGAPYTKGHDSNWKDKNGNTGRQIIEELTPYSYMKTALYFPAESKTPGYGEFNLSPDGNNTKVVWSMKGSMPFMMRGMGLLMGMNKMLGKTFDKGLNNLKRECEK
jgi:hypothetical protein